MYEEGDQGEGRVVRWTNGIRAMMHSPLVGFGPGSYSGEFGPFESKEAHNSLVDWGASTGMLGIALHLSLFAWCLLRCLRAGQLILFAMLTALAGASMFGYFLRQPIYWMLLVLAVMLSARPAPVRSPTVAIRSPDPTDPARAGLSAQH
jgi:O-antigen ligase